MYKLKTGRHFERVLTPVPTTSSVTINSTSGSSSTGPTTISLTNQTTSSVTGGPDSKFSSTTTLTSTSSNLPSPNYQQTGGTTITQISHAVTNVELCLDSRLLLVAGASGQVTLFRFAKTESCQDIAVIVLSQLCTSFNAPSTPTPSLSTIADDEGSVTDGRLKPQRGASSSSRELKRQNNTLATLSSRDSHSTDTSYGSQAEQMPLKVRGGALRRPAGYQVFTMINYYYPALS